MPHADVVVIGAGISGLTVAYRLAQSGHDVVVLSGPSVGGLIQSSTSDGFALEHGATTLACKPALMALLKDLGLESELQFPTPDLKNLIQFNGTQYAVPSSLYGLLRWRLIGWRSKIKLLRAIFSSSGLPPEQSTITVEQFFSKWLTPEIAQRVVAPLIAGIFGGRTRELLIWDMFPDLMKSLYAGGGLRKVLKRRRNLGTRKFCAVRGGNCRIVERMSEYLATRVKHERVISIVPQSGRYLVQTDTHCWSAGALVIATQPSSAAPMFREFAPNLAESLANVHYASLAVNHLLFQANEVPANSFGVLTVPPHPNGAIGMLFPNNIFGETAKLSPATLSFGGTASWDEASFTNEGQVKTAAMNLVGKLPQKVIGHTVWKEAIPQYDAAAREARSAAAELAAQHSGLYFCWALTGGVGVPDRVADAEAVTIKIREQKISREFHHGGDGSSQSAVVAF